MRLELAPGYKLRSHKKVQLAALHSMEISSAEKKCIGGHQLLFCAALAARLDVALAAPAPALKLAPLNICPDDDDVIACYIDHFVQ